MSKRGYTLLGRDGRSYERQTAGTLGGHRRGKIYGRLNCRAAQRAIADGGYEQTALAAGYRPCAVCLPEKHRAWKPNQA